MKVKILYLIPILYLISSTIWAQRHINDIQVAKHKQNNRDIYSLKINNKGNKYRFKYFITTGNQKGSLENDFLKWSKNKKIITAFTGSYMSECTPKGSRPLGFSINEGVLINAAFDGKLEAIVIIDAVGSLQVVNVRSTDFTIRDQNSNYRKIDFKNVLDRNYFIKWAAKNKISVFQTHLLLSDNRLNISPAGKTTKSERRFLTGGDDQSGNANYYIFSLNEAASLYEAASATFQFIKENKLIQSVNFMINLDMGCQNYYRIFKEDGNIFLQNDMKNQAPLNEISNLIVLYEN